MMTWNDVTVYQWQKYIELVNAMPKEVDELVMLDFNISLVALMYSMTSLEVEIMPTQEFTQKLKDLDFLKKDIEYKPKKRIFANGQWYKINYDIRKIRNKKQFALFSKTGDIITIKQLSNDFVGNIHKIFATMVTPQKKVLGLYFNKKYEYKEVEQYSEDLLYASIVDVYSVCVFFWNVLNALTQNLLTFSANQLKAKDKKTAEMLEDLATILDGYIAQQNVGSI